MTSDTRLTVELVRDGRPTDIDKMSAEYVSALSDGWFEASEDVVDAIRAGGSGKAPPVYWPFLTGQSKLGIGADQRGFFVDNQTDEPEIEWQLHNQAANPVGSSNFYAPIVEADRGVIDKWLDREGREMMQSRVEDVLADRLG